MQCHHKLLIDAIEVSNKLFYHLYRVQMRNRKKPYQTSGHRKAAYSNANGKLFAFESVRNNVSQRFTASTI